MIILFFDVTIYNISIYKRSNYNKKKIKTFEFNERTNDNKISKVFNSTSYCKKEFFSIREVEEQIYANNLTEITTIFGSHRNVGNALIILNKLINICERIKCKNIIIPYGLRTIIKKPIYYQKFNITIFPYSYRKIIKIDIALSTNTIFYLKFRKESFKNRLYILREEIVNNIPKVDIMQNELLKTNLKKLQLYQMAMKILLLIDYLICIQKLNILREHLKKQYLLWFMLII